MFDYSKLKLEVGDQRAENDELLHESFVSLRIRELIGSRTPTIIVGRKGSGKSALRVKFAEELMPNQRSFTLTPSTRDLPRIFEYIVENKENYAIENLSILWEISVLIKLINNIVAEYPSDVDLDAINDISSKLRGDIARKRNYGIGRTLSLIADEFPTGRKREDLARALRSCVRKSLHKIDVHFYVFIDSIDDVIHRYVDTSSRADLFSSFYQGLLEFFRDFTNREVTDFSDKVFLNLLIPLDVFSWASIRHVDQIGQYRHSILWDDEQLDRFIRTRLLTNLPPSRQRPILSQDENKQSDLVWNEFLPPIFPTVYYTERKIVEAPTPTRVHFIDMTLRRPRDLQVLFGKVSEHTRNAGLSFPTQDTLEKALKSYSVQMRLSVEAEYEHVFPDISKTLAKFSGNSPIIDRSVLVGLIKSTVDDRDHYRVAHILYEAGVIGGLREEEHDMRRAEFHFSFQDFETIWNHSGSFVVHKAFWHAL